jgi:signal transduction histidine kinase
MEGIFPYTTISSGFFTLGWKPLGAVTSQQSKYFQHIHGSALHLLGIINDILNLSKIKSEVVDLKESKVEILAIVDSTLRILKEHAENSGLELVNQVSPDLPKLWADERVVKQVLINLLSNSVKFTQPGGSVRVEAEVDHLGSMEIWISDTGIGMTTEDIDKAITMFGQVDGDLNRNFEGTGLNLPLVKSHIEAHGGELIIASSPGIGTIMTARFPPDRTIGVA